MAALKPLLDAECGTTNPLIKLSQFYTRDNTLVTQDGLIKPTTNTFTNANLGGGGSATIDELVTEYYAPEHHRPIAAPNTFNLEGLLSGLRLADDTTDNPNKHEYEWTSQFFDSLSTTDLPSYSTNTPKSSPYTVGITTNNNLNNNSSASIIHPPQHSSFSHHHQQQLSPPPQIAPQQQPSQWMPWNEQAYIPTSSSFLLNSNSNFFDQSPSIGDAAFDNDTVKAAQSLLALLQETQLANDTEFKTFVEHVAGGNGETPVVDADKQQATREAKNLTAENWADEFSAETDVKQRGETSSNNMWNDEEWQNGWPNDTTALSSSDDQIPRSQSWLSQFMQSVDTYSEYKFAKANPLIDHANPFEEGLKRLEIHDIVNAVLLFEAAVQKQADHVDAWLYLGITQSENEQDAQAICALKKCVELDPKNLQAYITLASCYANEMLTSEALDSLRKWLANNDKYAHLMSTAARRSTSNSTTDGLSNENEPKMIDELAFEELQELFLQAVSSSNNPNEIDSDLQVCLGVLFHLPGDYDKAAECFNTAVLAKPDDALLWNKLGAALANGGQSEKAVDAYYHALTLSPGFVRARYNLGISCFNLSAYKQAVEHFLTALKQQSDGIGPQGTHVQMSENIWRTLAIAIGHLQRPDLEQSVASKDLTRLLDEFQIE